MTSLSHFSLWIRRMSINAVAKGIPCIPSPMPCASLAGKGAQCCNAPQEACKLSGRCQGVHCDGIEEREEMKKARTFIPYVFLVIVLSGSILQTLDIWGLGKNGFMTIGMNILWMMFGIAIVKSFEKKPN